MRFSLFNRHAAWLSRANGYVDNELATAERSRFDAHLAGCHRCKAALAELDVVKAAIAQMVEVSSPHSFRLTPAMVADVATVRADGRRPSPVFLRGAQFATGIAAAAFVVSLAVGVLDQRGGNTNAVLTASSDHETSAQKSGAPSQDSSSNRSAVGGAGQEAPKAHATVASSPPATPSAPVTGASAGNGTGEVVSPGASPRPPATDAQPLGPSPVLGSTGPPTVAPAAPATGAGSQLAPPVTVVGTLSLVNGEEQFAAAPPSPGEAADSHSRASRLRVLQSGLGALTLLALIALFAASKRRGRNF